MFDNKKRQQIQSGIRHKVMFNNNVDGKFDVIDAEPGVGKTTAIIDAVPHFIAINPDNKVLIVTPFTREKTRGEFIVDALNRAAGKSIAVGVDSKNAKMMKSLAEQYPVVVITSKRFKDFGKNPHQLKVLGDGRLHIIDETVNYVEPIYLTNRNLNDLELLMPKPIDMTFRTLTGVIRDALANDIGKPSLLDLDEPIGLDDSLSDIINVVEATYTEEYKRELSVDESIKLSKSTLKDRILQIKEFYNKRIFINKDHRTGINKVYTFDSRVIPSIAEHNLMIDASASISKQYESEFYNIIRTPKARNYSQFKIHVCNRSSSKQSINNLKDFEKTAMNYVKENISIRDDVLVLSYMNKLDKLAAATDLTIANSINFDKVHKLVGTNAYEDCNKLFIFGTPNINGEATLLNYQYYINKDMKVRITTNYNRVLITGQISEEATAAFSKSMMDLYNRVPLVADLPSFKQNSVLKTNLFPATKMSNDQLDAISLTIVNLYDEPTQFDLRDDIPLKMTKVHKSLKYVFDDLEDYKVRQIADDLVQAILRINRDGTHPSDVYIMNSNDAVINKVVEALPGAQLLYDFDIEFHKQRKDYDNLTRRTTSAATRFIQLLQELDSGTHKKSDIRHRLGLSHSSDLTRILRNANVVDFISRNGIVAEGQKIIKPVKLEK
ncbi:MAG: hypothetical protein JEZ08_03375 [Clostridiales bacterium]|nr:hypothetical protein [Clostridiales bacterium]